MKMKQLGLFRLFLLFFAGCALSHVQAQQHLENWMKKCENNPSVDMETMYREGQKSVRIIVTDESLMNELTEAFNKDKENASEYSDKRVKGEISKQLCSFIKGEQIVRDVLMREKKQVNVMMQTQPVKQKSKLPSISEK
jgi:hypothetical protein